MLPFVKAKLDDEYLKNKYPGWNEPWDINVPRGGWLEDFVTATKGIEAPSSFCTWTALGTLSAALARESYFERFPTNWYPNMYIVLVAIPGLAKKSTIINYGSHVLRSFHKYVPNLSFRILKEIDIHSDSITAEGLQKRMAPVTVVQNVNGERVEVDKGSRIALFVSELSIFLGMQSYKVGLIQKLTDFYDGRSEAGDYTKGEGAAPLKDIFVSFIAGTTPDDMTSAIPQSAFGGGLMSRTVVVYERDIVRIREDPFHVGEAASTAELQAKLAWITVKGAGAYVRSPECEAYYKDWYRKHKRNIIENSGDVLSISRMDLITNKLSLLIRAQRYEEGRTITVEDFQTAEVLLRTAYEENKEAVAGIGASDHGKKHIKVETYLQNKGSVVRRDLLSWTSKYLNSAELSEVLTNLCDSGKIRIRSARGDWVTTASREGLERYIWQGGKKHE